MDTCGPILVVDPDRGSRELLATVLARLDSEVRTAESARAARRALDERPSLVVLEVDLPDGSGYELCREVQERYGDDLPVIFVAERGADADDRIAGLLLGADDYLGKPFDTDELLARARRSLRRSRPGPQRRGRAHDAVSGGLTERELQVLTLLTEGRSQKEIASDLVISPKTVGTHIQRILGKLETHSRAEAVALALREGLVGGEVRAHGAWAAPHAAV